MSPQPLDPGAIGQPERATQNRVIELLRNQLGYEFLGNWHGHTDTRNVVETLLRGHLLKAGYPETQVTHAISRLRAATDRTIASKGALYDNNKAVYSLLRYGIDLPAQPGGKSTHIELIDWKQPGNNHFSLAEEVTLRGGRERRIDVVLFVNGIALGTLELKNSRTDVGIAIRQSISNQSAEYNASFFSTVQFIFAANDSEGLRYGTIGTEEKFFLQWKEDEAENTGYKLDKYLLKLCAPARLLELVYDFVLFDGGKKKLPRPHQYFGVKAAQEHVRRREGGILWHTQGSGKSIVMVLLAKWVLETFPNARIAILTDRDELDKQIMGVFTDIGEHPERASSGRNLMEKLALPLPRLLCSLIHKFGRPGTDDFAEYIRRLEDVPTPVSGDLFVFVDECHRTQGGKMHRAMKAVLPNAVLIGFTGTPLLKTDSASSREVFGGYIHTYKFNEAVSDKVVLDLLYEARDIEQQLGPAEEIDAWFDVKTRGLNTWQRDALRERWGTMQTVLSSRNRMDRVVADVLFDFSVKPRLNDGRGNAILVASSIYEACKYYELFSRTPLRDHCAIVTSFAPQNQNLTTEDTGANSPTDKQFILDTYNGLLRDVTPVQRKSKAETYEDAAKLQFKNEPARMKLLIVVDKLLTGFDAPGCTYLYIDKEMRNHGLFQAICRTNRLDDATKDFGYIVDYKRLFGSVTQALQVYTAELEEQTPGTADSKVLMQTRLANNRKQLDVSMEQISLLTEPVEPPKGELEQIRYFCGNSEIASDLEERAPLRTHLYRQAASLVRAYANIKDELREAGYSSEQVTEVSRFVLKAVQLRDTVRHASQETLDLKAYESDMRHLIDTYVEAARPQRISEFGDRSLLEIIAAHGVDAGVDSLPEGVLNDPRAVAEVIANNVRRKIVQEAVADPAFYESMSQLLAEIVAALRARSIDYREFLRQAAELAVRVQNGSGLGMPAAVNTPGRRALYSNLGRDEDLALRVDAAVQGSRQDSWRGNVAKEKLVKRALAEQLESDAEVERVFTIAKEHY